MHKILVVGEHLHPVHVTEDTITVRFEEAQKMLTALREEYFSECKVVLAKTFDPVQCRFFVHIPRLLKPEGRLILDCKELSAGCKSKLTDFIDDLGLHIHANSDNGFVIGKDHPSTAKNTPAQKLHIGFYQQLPSKPAKIDEDELLKDDVVDKKPKIDACITKPKACANCKCGRKEAEQFFDQAREKSKQEVVQEINQGVVKSSCGNCYLGDAFRCAGCPYKGLPAFKPGEKVSLNLTEEVAGEAEAGRIEVQSGKVKLQL